MPRTLPDAVVDLLRDARAAELAVLGRLEQYRATVRAHKPLFAAIAAAGWTYVEMAAVLDITPQAVGLRVRGTAPQPGLNIPAPPEPPARPPAPGSDIDRTVWLTSAEARSMAGICVATLMLWRRAGLLPRTTPQTKTNYWYHRGDLERILAAPRYRHGGVDSSAVLQAIASGDHAPARGV
jgi:hypothetical protein